MRTKRNRSQTRYLVGTLPALVLTWGCGSEPVTGPDPAVDASFLAVAAPGPTLSGEVLEGFGSVTGQSRSCLTGGTTTLTFNVSGVAGGPFPGTFTESGTVVLDFQLDLLTGFMIGTPVSFNAVFEIVSGPDNVSGSKQNPLSIANGIASCEPTTGTVFFRSTFTLPYQATITTPAESFQDTGQSIVNIRIGGLDTFVFGGSAASDGSAAMFVGEPVTLTETFVSDQEPSGPVLLVLNPSIAVNAVGTEHCVTATAFDAMDGPVEGVLVVFTVTGSVTASGSATTDASGNAAFCYNGPPFPGEDVITAFADADEDGTQDPDELSAVATKTWVLPPSSPLCEIKITQGGRITAQNGDKATFGGVARSTESGETSGQEEYQDHGPAQPMNVHSINVLAITCDGANEASIYGQATVDGSGSHFYRIKVRDRGEPGILDTYWIILSNGYDSGDKRLQGGNVQIHRGN
jgi:hypothetical protein